MEIKENLTKRNYTKGNGKQNKYIVIHFVGAVSSAKANSDYFKSTYRGASAHYFVDDKDIYRVVRDNDIAWHCGSKHYKHLSCRNSNSIGIEMCCYNKNGKLDISENVINRTIQLTRELMAKYNIPVQNVIRHYDVTGKNCPAPMVENPARWNAFKSQLTSTTPKYNQGDAVEINTPMYFTGAVEGNRYLYDDTAETFWIGPDTKSLIKNDNLLARATFVWDEGDVSLVQVFNDQFRIKSKYIRRKL